METSTEGLHSKFNTRAKVGMPVVVFIFVQKDYRNTIIKIISNKS